MEQAAVSAVGGCQQAAGTDAVLVGGLFADEVLWLPAAVCGGEQVPDLVERLGAGGSPELLAFQPEQRVGEQRLVGRAGAGFSFRLEDAAGEVGAGTAGTAGVLVVESVLEATAWEDLLECILGDAAGRRGPVRRGC